jgi:hypothetical protein
MHAPFAQPKAQVTSCGVYEQVPPAQVPALEYVRSTVGAVQNDAGGWLHVLPAHGSPTHEPASQPNWHITFELS